MRIALAVAAVVWVASARGQETVVLRAPLSEGQVFRYDVDANLSLKSGSGAKAREDGLEQHLRVRFAVARVDPDGALVRAGVESVKVKTTGQDAAAFEWKEGDGPGPEEEPPLAAMYRQLSGTVFEVLLDRRGVIQEVSGLDRVAAAGRGLANPARALGVLEPEAAARMLQGVFAMDPGGEVRKAGDSWTVVQDVNTGVWPGKASTKYTVKQVGADQALVTGRTTLELRTPKQGGEETRPRVSITDQSITIDAAWNVRDGRLAHRVTEGTVSIAATIPVKQPIEATSESRSRVEFTLVEARSPRPEPAK
jgi:hypothetical protein